MIKDTLIQILEGHLSTIPYDDAVYRAFIQNRIIRLNPQPRNEWGGFVKYKKVPTGPIHISLKPQLLRRYQAFLVSEYKSGKWGSEIEYQLDKMINKTYKRVGKLYERVNKHYEYINKQKENYEKF
jgi:hypothetical protein